MRKTGFYVMLLSMLVLRAAIAGEVSEAGWRRRSSEIDPARATSIGKRVIFTRATRGS